MSPKVQAFFDVSTNTVSYLVSDPATKAAAIIDPVLDFDPKAGRMSTGSSDGILSAAREQSLDVCWILETHAHADHLSAANHLRALAGAKVVIGAQIREVQQTFGDLFEIEAEGDVFDRLVSDGEVLPMGDLKIEILHTPGHTPACVTYRVGDAAFVGDTLFMPDYGTARADFPGGDAATLFRSIRKILDLPGETRIFVGHDYLPPGRDIFRWRTTVAEERAGNIHVRDGVDEAQFVAMRQARDATLPAPTLILPAMQVNIRAGALPQPSAKGRLFLKLPINGL